MFLFLIGGPFEQNHPNREWGLRYRYVLAKNRQYAISGNCWSRGDIELFDQWAEFKDYINDIEKLITI